MSASPSPPSNKKWKSLFQLSSSRRRRGSNFHDDDDDNAFGNNYEPNDELQDDDLFLTKKPKCQPGSRRPSAPAILVDLKNFFTNVTRRSSSSYGLCTSASSKDNVYGIPTDPIHLVALKEHSPSIKADESTEQQQQPNFHLPTSTENLRLLEPPQSLHKAAKKHWKKTFAENSSNPLLSAGASSSSSLIYTKHHSNVSSTDSLSTKNTFIVVNRIGDDISSSKDNCQTQQQFLSSLSKTKSLSIGSINRENSEVPSHPQQSSDSSISATAVKSATVVGVQEQQQQTRTPEISSPIIVTKSRIFQKRQRDIVQDASDSEECGDDLYLRRHTIGSISSAMTVAAYGMVICGGQDDLHGRYRGRIEKVKFGVPINEAFSHDIPATLLVLLLKVNKEGPLKKDIWRAPGNAAQVRKLSHIMQHGRLVNISNISVYTAASVIKKFLSKLPGGIFGSENEQELFGIVQQPDNDQQRNVFCRVICNLSVPSQHLLVLLFGTFRIISDSADTFGTRMTPEAIGISVAPSLFHTCMNDNQRAKLEDVMRFKLASQVISKIIQGFGYTNLFPRECYEFYARITGRTLRVDEHWHFTFQFPSITGTFSQPAIHRACDSPIPGQEGGDIEDEPGPSGYNRRRNTDIAAGSSSASSSTHYQKHQHQQQQQQQSSNIEPLEKEFAGQRLSSSMGEVLIHTGYESDVPERMLSNQCPESFESTRSLTYLEWVHEKQTKRMRTRSEWFLSPVMPTKNNGASKSVDFKQHKFENRSLLIPKSDIATSSSEDMQISPIPKTVTSSSASDSEEPKTPRQPFQEIQESSTPTLPTSGKSSGGGSSEATTPLAKNQASIFFSQAQGGPILPAVVAVTPAPRVASTSGVVRRKSWRTHYVRPNKSFDQETVGQDIIESSSHSTPARRSSTGMPLAEFEVVESRLPETTRAIIRRKSSGSNNGKGKVPVSLRRSTQI